MLFLPLVNKKSQHKPNIVETFAPVVEFLILPTEGDILS